MKVWWSVVAAAPPPRLYFCLKEGQDRISFHILVARGQVSSWVVILKQFSGLTDPILQVRLHPGIFHVLPLPPSHLSDCQNFDLFMFSSGWWLGNKARKAKYNVRASIVSWCKLRQNIGNNWFKRIIWTLLMFELTRSGQQLCHLQPAIRDLISCCGCDIVGQDWLMTLCCISILTRHVWTWPAGSIL